MNDHDGGNYNTKIKQTAGRDQLSGLADEFAKVNDDILFGEVWSDDAVISPKTRFIITISVMIGKGLLGSSFTHRLAFAKASGDTREEIGRIITHAGFYAGWPNAWATFHMAKEVFIDDNINHGGYFGTGEENKAYAKYFTGTSYLKTLTPKDAPQAITTSPSNRDAGTSITYIRPRKAEARFFFVSKERESTRKKAEERSS